MILDSLIKQKRTFDENSETDIKLFAEFYRSMRWGPDGCPFELEAPHVSIPDMIKEKLITKLLASYE